MSQTTIDPKAGARAPGEANAVLQMTSLSQMAAEGPVIIESAKGNKLWDVQGREYFDGVNGLFNVNIGYGRTELADAAAATMGRLSYASNYFGRAHSESLELSAKLASITPDGIERFFLTVGGSDAVDTAIKLVRHANVLAGKPEKMQIIARRDGFHGMTLGGTALTGVQSLRDSIGPLYPGITHIGQPGSAGDNATADQLEAKILELGPENVAAFIGEPVSLPPGVAFPPSEYWPAIREVCTKYNVRLIADEVITGFGRTGSMFASDHYNIQPDLMTMSKGITSGYIPLGAVGMRAELYDQLAKSDGIMPHGFTGGGHPVSCAVALANIAILENEGLVQNAATVGEYLNSQLRAFADRHEVILGIRSLGMLGAFDVDGAAITGSQETASDAGYQLLAELTKTGLLIRPYGTAIAIGPALSTTRADVDELFSLFDATLNRILS